LVSPRIGVNYDVAGDRSIIIRGGAGIFSGRLPFVWLSNQFVGTGTMFNTINVRGNSINGGNGFIPDVDDQTSGGTARNTFEVSLIDRKFKMPQVLRVNAATDVKMPGDINLTIEAIYSKTINNIYYQDINLKAPASFVDPVYNNGFDKRDVYAVDAAARAVNPNITNALLAKNTSKGYSVNAGFTANRSWKHIFTQITYNYNAAADVNSGASSTALSNWQFVQVVNDPNSPQLAISNYALKHRITGVISVNCAYGKHFKTTLSLFYSGNSGQYYSYLVGGVGSDLNNDGSNGNDLIYVPRNAGEIHFVDLMNSNGTLKFTAAQQAESFQAFIDRDPYLKKRRGKYAERNGRKTPWEHVVDARLAQDFYIKAGSKTHTLQLTVDMFNLTNLLNKEWGRQYTVTNQAFNLLTLVRGKGYNYDWTQNPLSTSFGSRWQGQVGVRYTFN